MFVLSNKQSLRWPVKYGVPKDGGKFENVQFECEFKRLSQTRLEELSRAAQAGEIKDDDFINEVLLGWSGIKQTVEVEGKQQLQEFEYSDQNKLLLFDQYPGMRSAMVLAFQESVQGALRKN